MRLLSNAGAILLVLYRESGGLLTPDIVTRVNHDSEGLVNVTLTSANVTLGEMSNRGYVAKERTEERSDRHRNPPNRVFLTPKGRRAATALTTFFERVGGT